MQEKPYGSLKVDRCWGVASSKTSKPRDKEKRVVVTEETKKANQKKCSSIQVKNAEKQILDFKRGAEIYGRIVSLTLARAKMSQVLLVQASM